MKVEVFSLCWFSDSFIASTTLAFIRHKCNRVLVMAGSLAEEEWCVVVMDILFSMLVLFIVKRKMERDGEKKRVGEVRRVT